MRTLKFLLIGILSLAAIGYGGAKAYIYYKVSDGVETALMMSAPYAQIDYSGIGSTLTGELVLEGVNIRAKGYRDSIVIERLGIKTENFLELIKLTNFSPTSQSGGSGAPEYFGFIAQGIRIPVSSDYYRDMYQKNLQALQPDDIRQRGVQCVGKYGFSPKTLRKLGYEEMVISASVVLRQEDNRFITEMTFDIIDMTDLDIKVAMGGSAMAGVAMGAAYQPTLHNLEIEVTDRSLNQRVTRHCTELGLTPAQITRAQLNALQHFGDTLGITFDEYVIDPYKEYLAGKSTFIATARPRAPLEMASIDNYAPSDIPALLNREAVAH